MYISYFFCIILISVCPIFGLSLVTPATIDERNSVLPAFAPQLRNITGQLKSTLHPVSPLPFLISNRQKADNRPLCPQFNLKYGVVRKVTNYMIRMNRLIDRRFKICQTCVISYGCEDKQKRQFVTIVNKCLNTHSFGACYVAIGILNRLGWIRFGCIPYLKSSRIGNCYVQEYLTLNGYRGKNNNLIFYRESGIYEKKRFQCTAGRRAKLPLPWNRLSCRHRFRVTPLQVSRVYTCAWPASTKAHKYYSQCMAIDPSLWLFCHQEFTSLFNNAYRKCVFPHGLEAVFVAATSVGSSAYDCPTFRRDSWVGRCKADDYVQLSQFELLHITDSGNFVFKRRGLCKYSSM